MIGSRRLPAELSRVTGRITRLALCLALSGVAASVSAQAVPVPAEAETPAPAPVEVEEEEVIEEEELPPEAPPAPANEGPSGEAPNLNVANQLTLDDAEPEGDDAPREDWTQPIPVLTLHGYLRVRGEIQDTFWLGRGGPGAMPLPYSDPFTGYRSTERAACATASRVGCDPDTDTLAYGTMRFRFSPQLNLSDEVRVHATFDALDNVVAGSGPASFYDPALGRTYASTLQSGTVSVRRAWAEIRNRDLGELRFGRMAAHWGLGMVQNAGNQLDDDFSTEVDRVMVFTKLRELGNLYLSAAYDFSGEGATRLSPAGLPIDASQRDDVDQFTFSVAKRLSAEELQDSLARGDVTFQAGGMFNYRVQDLAARSELVGGALGAAPTADEIAAGEQLVNVDATTYNFDAWAQLRWRGLRLEVESALVLGSVGNTLSDGSGRKHDVLQFGTALEAEYRLLDEKLGLYFYSGIASGDPDGNGLSSGSNFVAQDTSNRNISTFRFHPTYRVDLILWRHLMQQVTGAYYFKPGISYDFARDPFGQLLGARLDVIWSRAVFVGQTWGGDSDLGVEINASVYWRGEDGPEIDDGFHAILQYGYLFPMQGLWYRTGERVDTRTLNASADIQTAQTVRLILGVVY